MSINWFPGHMNKTRQQLAEAVTQVHGVLEIVDARAPISSRNPMLNQIIGEKPRLILLNKADLADNAKLLQWLKYFESNKIKALPLSAKTRTNVDRLKGEITGFMKKKASQSRTERPKALIVGIPNCGKSTLINALARQKKANVADKPGVTRDMALYKVGQIDLYDSPGTLWPNLEDQLAAARLAALGAIKDEIYIVSEAFSLVYPFLSQHYAGQLKERYHIDCSEDGLTFAAAVALKLGRNDDAEAGALAIFKDLRAGKLGKIVLELPE
ncbi:MAG: ribosome biogenesis GTPase YlqF [Spirochaetaceae bacterium]|nr:ribosome biogenesis GTPase YlqF [Spirochaetaceae bacterium]